MFQKHILAAIQIMKRHGLQYASDTIIVSGRDDILFVDKCTAHPPSLLLISINMAPVTVNNTSMLHTLYKQLCKDQVYYWTGDKPVNEGKCSTNNSSCVRSMQFSEMTSANLVLLLPVLKRMRKTKRTERKSQKIKQSCSQILLTVTLCRNRSCAKCARQ